MSDTQEDQDNSPPEDESAEDSPQEQEKPGASLPERVTLAVTVLLILALAVFLGWHALRDARSDSRSARPQVTARVDVTRAASQPQGWAVPVVVTNAGNVPMREVMVKVEVRESDGKSGERELTFGFLAEGATETGYVTTFVAPDADPPTATIQSFQTKADARGY